ncbi:MAG TPA: TonB family protein [Candidatus Baltobacteraceae bacterium]|nr:TonB family protein [Candidatus Baltobacteraceae bacterium]
MNARTCARPNAEAAVDFALFDTPTIAMEQGVSGVTTLRISLNDTGALTGASLVQSSGNMWIDRSAMNTAYTSAFTPKIQNCSRVASAYLYQVSY